MTNLIWSVVLSLIGILGIYLAGSKNIIGWVVGLFAQILWIIFALTTGQYGFLLSAAAYGSVYARNYIRWRKDSKEKEEQT